MLYMPTSFFSSITNVMTLIMALDPPPRTILDVGIGMGKYGLLCREYLTHWDRPTRRALERIDGIEAYAPNVTALQKNIYDEIFFGDAREILPTLQNDAYDLALLMDVIEHFDQRDGEKILRELQRVARVVLVSTPSFFYEQGKGRDDPFAVHRSFWSARDLKGAGAFFILEREATLAVFAREAKRKNFRGRFEILRVKTGWMPAWVRRLMRREK